MSDSDPSAKETEQTVEVPDSNPIVETLTETARGLDDAARDVRDVCPEHYAVLRKEAFSYRETARLAASGST